MSEYKKQSIKFAKFETMFRILTQNLLKCQNKAIQSYRLKFQIGQYPQIKQSTIKNEIINKMNQQSNHQRPPEQSRQPIQGITSGDDMHDQYYGNPQAYEDDAYYTSQRGRGHGANYRGAVTAQPRGGGIPNRRVIVGRGQNVPREEQFYHYQQQPQYYPAQPYNRYQQQQQQQYYEVPSYPHQQQQPPIQYGYYYPQHQIHHRSRGSRAPRGGRGQLPQKYQQPQPYMEYPTAELTRGSRPPIIKYQQQPHRTPKTSYIVHKRQFASPANEDDPNQEVFIEEEVEEHEPQPMIAEPIPLTKVSRVLRRGRGTRAETIPIVPIQENFEEALPEEELMFEPESQISSVSGNRRGMPIGVGHTHKIIKKSNGRGQRILRAGATGGIDSFESEVESNQPQRQPRGYTVQAPTYQYEEQEYYRQRPYRQERGNFAYGDEECSESYSQQYVPEYETYGDYQAQYPKRPSNNIKYRLKTFDDEIESDVSFDENASGDNNVRRGPKLIKFKQKKPSERLALSQLKSEQTDKNETLDVYTPLNTQTNTNKIQILKPYKGFEQPEFYQGPQWKFIRQSTNQNSKQKHYEKGEYDKVQYNFPGAENELQDKETDGEQKLYPPIEDYSDEDVGIAPSSSNLRAKVTFNKSTKSLSESEQLHIPGTPGMMPNAFELQQKGAKGKKPAVSNKAFTFDQNMAQASKDSMLIQGLAVKQPQGPVTMEFAERFFVQEQDQLIEERKNNKQFFEKYINDQAIIEQKLKQGLLWKGVVRMNPKFRHRAYVSIKELNVDVLVESYRMINRALDGDTVFVELLPVHSWIETGDQNSLQAKITTLCPKTGMIQHGISHLKQTDNQAYTNENAIETRLVDQQLRNADQLSMSQSQSEDDSQIQPLNKNKPKRLYDDDVEGYNASNSDNNFDGRFGNKKNKSNISFNTKKSDPVQLDVASTKANNGREDTFGHHKLSQSSSDHDKFEDIEEKAHESSNNTNKQKMISDDDKDLWENLETNGIKGKILEPSVEQKKAMTIAEFLGHDTTTLAKQSSYNRTELYGSKSERISQINDYGKTLRPLAKIVGLTNSPNRECNQIVTLVEIEQDSSSQLYQQIKTKSQREKVQNSLIFAVPINDKLPWFILNEAPEQFIEDQNSERNPSHRYYIIKYQDWKTTQKRPHCTLVECIGEAGNLRAETLRLLKMHEICTENYEVEGSDTSIVHECLKVFAKNIDPKTKEWIIPQDEIKKRLDLRDKRVFTIDPITARDLDDALSIEKISDKVYEIGVHIADVSYFVQQGSDLDKEALKRGTSTYFVHQVFPMLPRLLCEQLCSLNPNVDRLTYSIFFKMNIGTGQVDKSFKPVIKRSIIKSCAKWSYELAQDVIKGKVTSVDQISDEMKPQGHSFIDMGQDLLVMNTIAQKRRKERLAAGSLVFNNRDFNFTLNPDTMYPIKYSESSRMESKQLVEEYMLLANILVAEHLFQYCKDKTLLRSHADILQNKKNELSNFFDKIGLHQINLSDSMTLSASIAELEQQPGSQDKVTVINRKFIQNLTQAKYVCVENKDPEEYAHYGLNFSLYTHFTSPIRRYSDLLVHRLLTICLKEKEATRDKIDGIDYSEYADIISEKSYNARKASKDCQALFHCFLLKDHGPRVYDCLIFDVEVYYLNIYVEELNLNLNVKLREDDRIDQTTFFDDDLKVACSFKTPMQLCEGMKEYQGDTELKKSKQQKKKEEEIRRMEKDNEDQSRRLNKIEEYQYRLREESKLSSNCIFSVFDRVKVKVEATDTFPMEIQCTLLITQDDMVEYDKLLREQEIKFRELEQINHNLKSQQIQTVNEEI